MYSSCRFFLAVVICLAGICSVQAQQTIRMPSDPSLSPDGKQLAFSWNGDIWLVPTAGGTAKPLTTDSADDSQPFFSPDGKSIAFISNRDGASQVYVVKSTGGLPKQLTFHSEGCALQGWFPDGKSLLILAQRDHFWRHAQRFFKISATERNGEEILFDAHGKDGSLSPNGQKLLFTREGERWWRQGYKGSRASQIWLYDMPAKKFTELIHEDYECRSPIWHPDGKSFYYVSGKTGPMNLVQRNLSGGAEKAVTNFKSDMVTMPTISRDGSTIVFRHLFDFYRLMPGQQPVKINISYEGDERSDKIVRRVLTDATDVAFTKNALEIAFISGGDLWVMDTVLREPKQITDTPEEESSPVFAPDGKSILFVSDAGGQSDIWVAKRGDAKKYWWQQDSFDLKKITNDAEVEGSLSYSPTGELVAYVKGRGDLYLMKPDGKDSRALFKAWSRPNFDWSPDGKWMVYTTQDDDFNSDVWIRPIDNSKAPVNISKHPDNEYNPRWSPDGKIIAFTGRRFGDESDIFFVYLQKEFDETGSRERKLEEALKAMKKQGGSGPSKGKFGKGKGGKEDNKEDDEGKEKTAKKLPEVTIDFDGISDRVRRISIPDTTESSLLWSPDSKKLVFSASIDGKGGLYSVEFPDKLKPKLFNTSVGRSAQWLADGNQIVWLEKGTPASLSASGKSQSFPFSVRQLYVEGERNKAAFDQCWRHMRDSFYDGSHNNKDWNAVRAKYAPMARQAADMGALADVVHMMLGELNGSHLGFTARGGRGGRGPGAERTWRDSTAHLGVRFDGNYRGQGWKVRDVIPDGPADRVKSKLNAGDIILAVDGEKVSPQMDSTLVLNGPMDRDIKLTVKNPQGKERTVMIRPTSFGAVRSLLYEAWIKNNRELVNRLSKGKLGYLHIQAMNMSSFYRFEQELYAAGVGKEGLIIDVRENGGGSTTDHLLTALTQPEHAITVPRGGDRGYPHDRKVYATWNKPIIVLCNQNSFSNAEIFSHAIKELKRGQVVGVPTAGGVISTGGTGIMDFGFLRMPFRGWYVASTGEDMELNGAVPHHIVWPEPGEWPSGRDRQIERAVQVLMQDVQEYLNRPKVKLRNASQR